jgi:hypothetical protein
VTSLGFESTTGLVRLTIDAGTGTGGPAYSALVVPDAAREIEFYLGLLDMMSAHDPGRAAPGQARCRHAAFRYAGVRRRGGARSHGRDTRWLVFAAALQPRAGAPRTDGAVAGGTDDRGRRADPGHRLADIAPACRAATTAIDGEAGCKRVHECAMSIVVGE